MYQNVSMKMLEGVRERGHATRVCVTGHSVASIFSVPYYTHHRCLSMYIIQREQICFYG